MMEEMSKKAYAVLWENLVYEKREKLKEEVEPSQNFPCPEERLGGSKEGKLPQELAAER
jgi:hypothetical protein